MVVLVGDRLGAQLAASRPARGCGAAAMSRIRRRTASGSAALSGARGRLDAAAPQTGRRSSGDRLGADRDRRGRGRSRGSLDVDDRRSRARPRGWRSRPRAQRDRRRRAAVAAPEQPEVHRAGAARRCRAARRRRRGWREQRAHRLERRLDRASRRRRDAARATSSRLRHELVVGETPSTSVGRVLRHELARRARARRRRARSPARSSSSALDRRPRVGRAPAARRAAARSGRRPPGGSAVPCGLHARLVSRPASDRRPGSASAASSSTFPSRGTCAPRRAGTGSKLRTARMMSMPLKCSRSFSSKIGVFITASSYGPGRAEAVARVRVPRRRRVRVVVGDLAALDHQVVREHAAYRFGEAAADALVGHLERLPRLGLARRGRRPAPSR